MKPTIFIVMTLFCGPLFGQPFNRTAVSINGVDTATCAVAEPCRSFSRALQQTVAGGEVIALDSGGYGPFDVNMSVTVQAAPGVHAAVTLTEGLFRPAIAIFPGPNDNVVIKGLSLSYIGSDVDPGISGNGGHTVHIEDCTVSGFGGGMVLFGFSTTYLIRNCTVRNTHSNAGIWIGARGASIDGTRLHNNNTGILITRGIVSVSNSNIDTSNGAGINAQGGSGTTRVAVTSSKIVRGISGIRLDTSPTTNPSTVMVSNTLLSLNTTGLLLNGATTTAAIFNCAIVANATGVSNTAGGPVNSAQNNVIHSNTTTNVNGALTPFATQ